MTKMLIDRPVVEQALHVAMAAEHPVKLIAALRAALAEDAMQKFTDVNQEIEAALAEPVQEPVAWRFEARHIDSAWAAAVTLKHPGPEGVYMRNVAPLYAAPPQRDALLEKINGVIAAERSEGRGRGGFVNTPPTREHQRRVAQAWQELHAAIKAAEENT